MLWHIQFFKAERIQLATSEKLSQNMSVAGRLPFLSPNQKGYSINREQTAMKFTSRPFFSNNNAKQLVLEALGSDHEVQQRHFGSHFRQVMRVAQLRCDVEPKVLAVLNDSFTKTNHFNTTWTAHQLANTSCYTNICIFIIPVWLWNSI